MTKQAQQQAKEIAAQMTSEDKKSFIDSPDTWKDGLTTTCGVIDWEGFVEAMTAELK